MASTSPSGVNSLVKQQVKKKCLTTETWEKLRALPLFPNTSSLSAVEVVVHVYANLEEKVSSVPPPSVRLFGAPFGFGFGFDVAVEPVSSSTSSALSPPPAVPESYLYRISKRDSAALLPNSFAGSNVHIIFYNVQLSHVYYANDTNRNLNSLVVLRPSTRMKTWLIGRKRCNRRHPQTSSKSTRNS
jgi:hypothetical protein